jgi:hypothetical protein
MNADILRSQADSLLDYFLDCCFALGGYEHDSLESALCILGGEVVDTDGWIEGQSFPLTIILSGDTIYAAKIGVDVVVCDITNRVKAE